MKAAALALAALPAVALGDNIIDNAISAIGGGVNAVTSVGADAIDKITSGANSLGSRFESDFNAGNNKDTSDTDSGAAGVTASIAVLAIALVQLF
ncbi:hypothetical protein H4R18_004797 [Coemansia javaensis]|uniref:Uncharacterized protein n=1 Tax=Coemansia javaensis TaxID=2761396 RepID=A0A9W8LEC3_9FUNG|nr:hypothetical protein H4R18_004797 [Coemansia javaensis]